MERIYNISKSGLFVVLFTLLSVLLASVVKIEAQANEFVLQGKIYRLLENGKWHNFNDDKIGDEITLNRIVLRKENRDAIESTDFQRNGYSRGELGKQPLFERLLCDFDC